MWQRETGQQVNGVIAIDPVTLGYLLKATGPVQLATGDTLTSDNAVKLLLSEAYAKYSDPKVQDAFFASAASAVFEKVSSGGFDAKQFVAALTRSAGEGRLRLWSADTSEEQLIDGTAVAGMLPTADEETRQFGVYLNDGTGSKMDYYLQKTISVDPRSAGRTACRPPRSRSRSRTRRRPTRPRASPSTSPEAVTSGPSPARSRRSSRSTRRGTRSSSAPRRTARRSACRRRPTTATRLHSCGQSWRRRECDVPRRLPRAGQEREGRHRGAVHPGRGADEDPAASVRLRRPCPGRLSANHTPGLAQIRSSATALLRRTRCALSPEWGPFDVS